MVNHKLLGEIFGVRIRKTEIAGNKLRYKFDEGFGDKPRWSTIDLYRLSNQFKEWAFEYGIKLISYQDGESKWVCTDKSHELFGGDFMGETEYVCVLSACDFIFNNKMHHRTLDEICLKDKNLSLDMKSILNTANSKGN